MFTVPDEAAGRTGKCHQCGTKNLVPGGISTGPAAPPPTPARATATPIGTGSQLYCRNCGESVAAQAIACMSCGLAPTNGNTFCRTCGSATHPEAVVCVKCGSPMKPAPPSAIAALEKCYYPFLIALIFAFGLGPLLLVLGLVLTAPTGSVAEMVRRFGLFIFLYGIGLVVALGLAMCNFIVARDNRFGTKPLDLIVLILAALSLALPIVGLSPAILLTEIAGCAVSIVALLRYLKTTRSK